jgi:hypothetical protein
MRDLEWSYRTPKIRPWRRVFWDTMTPVGELAVLILGIGAVYVLAVLCVVL